MSCPLTSTTAYALSALLCLATACGEPTQRPLTGEADTGPTGPEVKGGDAGVHADAGLHPDAAALADAVDAASALDIAPGADSGAVTDAGPGDAESDGGGKDASESDAAAPPITRQRSCATRFNFVPDGPVKTVQVAGEWDWAKPETLAPDGQGFSLDKTLPAGLYCYKFIVDGAWQLDPGNPYRAWCNKVENSGARVPDCKRPLLTLDGTPQVTGDGLKARLLLWRGSTDAAPTKVQAELRHDFAGTALSGVWQAKDESLDIALSGLKPGKYTVRITATDAQGRTAEPVLLPFWAEKSAFQWRGALIYLAMIDRFVDGKPANNHPAEVGVDAGAQWHGGDLAGVTSAIEGGVFDKLGVGVLWLTPWQTGAAGAHLSEDEVHKVTGYHGYWPIKARAIDPRYGTEADLEALVKAAHAHGIRVLMDLVVNHVHKDHEYVAAHPTWFRTGCVCGTAGCDWTEKALECLFRPYMPDIDWTHKEAAEQFLSDALWWIERFDLDGARTDAVKHVEQSATTNLVARVRETFETAGVDYFLTGETAMGWSGDSLEANKAQYAVINKYLGPHGLDGQFDFVLYHAVADPVFALGDKGLIHLDVWTQNSLAEYAPGAIMTTYVGSHDTARLVSRADYRGQAGHPKTTVVHKWADEVLPVEPGEDEPYERARVALCWLLTTPGAPMVYAGDEYGAWGGRDPDNRHMWRPETALSAREKALLAATRKLGQVRAALPALRLGAYQTLGAKEATLPFLRSGPGLKTVMVAVNAAPTAQSHALAAAGLPFGAGLHADALSFGGSLEVTGTTATLKLPPRSCAVFLSDK